MRRSALSNHSSLMLSTTTNGFNQNHRPPPKTNRDTSRNADDETMFQASCTNLSSTMRTAQCPKHHGHHIRTTLKSSASCRSSHRDRSDRSHSQNRIKSNYATPTNEKNHHSPNHLSKSPLRQQHIEAVQYQTLTNEPTGEDMTMLLGCSNGLLTASQLSIGRQMITPRGGEAAAEE